jgi:hypothetical protein
VARVHEGTVSITIERGDAEVEVEVSYRYSFSPGRFSGPPETCYPDETDVEILSTSARSFDPWGRTRWTDVDLTDAEEEAALTAIEKQESESPFD